MIQKGEIITSLMGEPNMLYQKNTRNTETYVSQLIWAMRSKKDISDLLFMALNILAKTEGNETFVKTVTDNLKSRKEAAL